MKFIIHLVFIPFLLTLAACKGPADRKPSIMSGAFTKNKMAEGDDYDIEHIHKGGELIIATISGPETYYDYRGMEMGHQFALAEHFAAEEGVGVRVELAKDTTELVAMLKDGTVDVIAYPLSASYIDDEGLVAAGYREHGTWAVRSSAPHLAQALDDWYSADVDKVVRQDQQHRVKQSHQVTRRAQAVYLSRDRGVISVYDNLFKNASAITGWDWKLHAAQCYQESAFDPNARSYVGAQGLMQIMPATAKELGLQPGEAWMPEKNINASARYIVKLSSLFNDIRDPQERIKFVLASYNGGTRHVRDAMALARKYGKNPFVWDDVAPYILGLQQPRYYKDPVVKYGYMIGSETAGYVQKILERWRDYGGKGAVTHAPQLPVEEGTASSSGGTDGGQQQGARRPARKNRFASGTKVLRPDDPAFNQMDQ